MEMAGLACAKERMDEISERVSGIANVHRNINHLTTIMEDIFSNIHSSAGSDRRVSCMLDEVHKSGVELISLTGLNLVEDNGYGIFSIEFKTEGILSVKFDIEAEFFDNNEEWVSREINKVTIDGVTQAISKIMSEELSEWIDSQIHYIMELADFNINDDCFGVDCINGDREVIAKLIDILSTPSDQIAEALSVGDVLTVQSYLHSGSDISEHVDRLVFYNSRHLRVFKLLADGHVDQELLLDKIINKGCSSYVYSFIDFLGEKSFDFSAYVKRLQATDTDNSVLSYLENKAVVGQKVSNRKDADYGL